MGLLMVWWDQGCNIAWCLISVSPHSGFIWSSVSWVVCKTLWCSWKIFKRKLWIHRYVQFRPSNKLWFKILQNPFVWWLFLFNCHRMDEFSVSIPLLYTPLFSCVFYWCDQYFSYFLEHASCFCFLLVALKVCRPTHWYILTWVSLRVDILLFQNFQKMVYGQNLYLDCPSHWRWSAKI